MRDEPIAGGRAIGFFVLAHAVECCTEFHVAEEIRVAENRVGYVRIPGSIFLPIRVILT